MFKIVKDLDLINDFVEYPIDISKVKNDEFLKNRSIIPEEDEVAYAYQYDIKKYHLEDATDWSQPDSIFYEEDIDEYLENLIKGADHYLIFAANCRWNGASGYKFVDDIKSAFYRSYDVSIYPVSVSKGGKILKCHEYSHDVPMGGNTYAIALTEREYERLNSWSTCFEDVEDFVFEQAEKLPEED